MKNELVHLKDVLIRYFAMPNCRRFVVGDLELKFNSKTVYKQKINENDKAVVLCCYYQDGTPTRTFFALENEIDKLCDQYELESEVRSNLRPITIDQELSKPYVIRIRKKDEMSKMVKIKDKLAKPTTY